MPQFTVEKCEAAETFKKEPYGEFQVWKVQVHDGQQSIAATLNTKLGKSGPSVGERIEGELTKGPHGNKLKRAAQSYGSKGGGGKSPQERKEIRRMASQRAGIELLAVEVAAGLRFENVKASDLLLPRVQWFEDDARKAGEKA